jgi:hypothetical protein
MTMSTGHDTGQDLYAMAICSSVSPWRFAWRETQFSLKSRYLLLVLPNHALDDITGHNLNPGSGRRIGTQQAVPLVFNSLQPVQCLQVWEPVSQRGFHSGLVRDIEEPPVAMSKMLLFSDFLRNFGHRVESRQSNSLRRCNVVVRFCSKRSLDSVISRRDRDTEMLPGFRVAVEPCIQESGLLVEVLLLDTTRESTSPIALSSGGIFSRHGCLLPGGYLSEWYRL